MTTTIEDTESTAERLHREGREAVAAQEHGWFEHQSKPVTRREGSGEPKTLTLTFPEAVELMNRDYNSALVLLPASPDQRGDVWASLCLDDDGELFFDDFSPTWEKAMSSFLGVPVVARDEAAESKPIGWDDVTDEDVMAALVKAQTEASVLRKAIREWDDALTKLNALIHGIPGHRDDVNAADDRLTAAEANLRRLAGGENEK